jgi:WD40 repeat protein
VLDAPTGKALFNHDLKEHGNGRGLAFVPGSSHILVTAEDKPQAFVFDISTRKVVRTVAFDGDYKDLVPAGRYVMARAGTDQVLLDRETGQVRARFRPSERWPTSVWTMTPDGRRVLLAGEDGSLRVFEAETGKKLEDLAPPPGWDRLIETPRLAVAPDGATAYLAARHGKVFRRDLKAGKWLDPVPTGPEGELIPHPDGKRLLVLGGDGVLRRYHLRSLRPLPGPEGFEYELTAYPSPDGRRVAIESGEGRQNGRLDLFDIAGRPVWSVRPGATRGPGWWSPDGRWLACVASHQVTVREAATGKVARVVPAPGEDARFFQRAYFPPGADRLVAPIRFGIQLVTVDLATDAPPKLIPLGARSVRDLAPDGRTFVCLPAGGGLWLFDVNTRQYTARRPDPDGERRAADVNPRFSPDGSYLLTWETEEGAAADVDPENVRGPARPDHARPEARVRGRGGEHTGLQSRWPVAGPRPA